MNSSMGLEKTKAKEDSRYKNDDWIVGCHSINHPLYIYSAARETRNLL
jgi:hypothetical protein